MVAFPPKLRVPRSERLSLNSMEADEVASSGSERDGGLKLTPENFLVWDAGVCYL